jgi:hypothetical protein
MAMSESMNAQAERDELEMLLPWHVTRRLAGDDAARLEASLDREVDLLRRLALVRDECDETILANETIAERPAHHADRLLAELARREAPRTGVVASLWQRFVSLLEMPSAGAMRFAGAAAAILIVVQAGLIGTLLTRQPAQSYAPASGGTAAERGALALVGFAGDATASAVAELLAADGMSIVRGPDAGGHFVVRLGPDDMGEAERQAKIAALRRRGDIVALVVPLR